MNAAKYSKWCLIALTVTVARCSLDQTDSVEKCIPHACPYRTISASFVDGSMSWDVGAAGMGINVDLALSRPCRIHLPTASVSGVVGWGHGVAIDCDLAVTGAVLTLFLPKVLDLGAFAVAGRTERTGRQLGLEIALCENPDQMGCTTTETPPLNPCSPFLDDVVVTIDVEEATGTTLPPPKLVTDDFRRVVSITFDTGDRPGRCGTRGAAVSLSLRLAADRSNYAYYPYEYCSCP